MIGTRDTPAAPTFVPALEPPSPVPLIALHEVAEYEAECAWHDGYVAALTDVAERHVELAHTWARAGQRRYEERVADRIAEMTATANAQHAQHGTTEWVGLDNGGVLPSADWTWNQPAGGDA